MARRAKQPGSGCVAERASKKHGTVYQIRWRLNGGKVKTSMTGPDRKEAEQALALKLAEINRGTYRERHEATAHEFASSWFADHKATYGHPGSSASGSTSRFTSCRFPATTCSVRSAPS